MSLDRRRFLAGSLLTAGLAGIGLGATAKLAGLLDGAPLGAGGSRPPQRPPGVGAGTVPGESASAGLADRGHAFRAPVSGHAGLDRADVVVVGGGVAGLTAAYRLGSSGVSARVLELWPEPGGTAIAGTGAHGPYPWGAHYVTMPGPDATHVRTLLRELGVITGFDANERPIYAPDALCAAPQERVWDNGVWLDGLWPEAHATPEDRAQHVRWEAVVAEWSTRVGADGRAAFTIPVAKCSRDPAIRALARLRFSDWLDQQGFTAPVMRWWLAYATRDDYGADLDAVSAWAGLHYFCARRPDPADARDLGTHVLAWPEGNGRLVSGLRARAADVRTGVVVRAVEADGNRARIWYTHAGGDTDAACVDASAVILAVPTRLARRLLEPGRFAASARPGPPDRPRAGSLAPIAFPDVPLPDHAPWRVAQLHVSALPRARGVPTAWDSVIYGARSLGYVTNTHQLAAYGGPSVLTWYEPLLGDPAAARAALLTETWEQARDHVLADLLPSHPDLLDVLERLDVWHWGHGTTIPGVGLHDGRLDALLDVHPRVQLAHSDLSGVSLFEEASWHGIRAAEAVLARLGKASGSWL